MPKTLKKAKKPLSWFLIISVLNSLIIGSVFNFNFKASYDAGRRLADLNFLHPEAIADTATTTVEVENTPPYFTVDPNETPISAAATPINMDSNITFNATAEDDEWHQYYLLVCDTNTASATNGGIPTCGGTEYCHSNLTAHNAPTSCTHATTNEFSEVHAWYAFVCDNHATQAKCSGSSQGSGDSGTPYYVNHPPLLYAVNTTEDYKMPGGVFRMTATSSDPDTQRVDTLRLYICDTNGGATYAGGCSAGNTLCTESGSTTLPNCLYTDTAPTDDMAYTYYAYVFDNFGMLATTSPVSNAYHIINIAPTVGAITLNGGANITPQIKASSSISVIVRSASVQDLNYCTDLVSATATAYISDAVNSANCTADGNSCYQYASTSCAISDCGAGASATFSCTTTIQHYMTPTDNSTANPKNAQSWFAALSVTDDDGAQGIGYYTTADGVEVVTVMGLEVTEGAIDYGILRAGTSTKGYNATTTVINYGNSPMNPNLSGTSMTRIQGGGNTINENNQKWSITNFYYTTGGTVLSSTTPARASINAPKPTSLADVSDEVYWGILVPAFTVAGNYAGQNLFTAILDQTNW
jgi:hypothetical protein